MQFCIHYKNYISKVLLLNLFEISHTEESSLELCKGISPSQFSRRVHLPSTNPQKDTIEYIFHFLIYCLKSFLFLNFS